MVLVLVLILVFSVNVLNYLYFKHVVNMIKPVNTCCLIKPSLYLLTQSMEFVNSNNCIGQYQLWQNGKQNRLDLSHSICFLFLLFANFNKDKNFNHCQVKQWKSVIWVWGKVLVLLGKL